MRITGQVLEEMKRQSAILPEEEAEVGKLLGLADRLAEEAGAELTFERALAMGVHLTAYVRRIRTGSYLPELEEGMFDEIGEEFVGVSRTVLESCERPEGRELDDAEIFYLAVHFEAARA